MSVSADDLKQPKGELERALFPGDSNDDVFNERLTSYLEEGDAQVTAYAIADDVDGATKAWAYYRAYHAIGVRLLASPRTAAIDGQGSRRYEQEQADSFFALAARWKSVFDDLIPEANAPEPTAVPSASLAINYQW